MGQSYTVELIQKGQTLFDQWGGVAEVGVGLDN